MPGPRSSPICPCGPVQGAAKAAGVIHKRIIHS